MSFLTGSAPKSQLTTGLPTTSPTQQLALGGAINAITGAGGAGPLPGTQYTATDLTQPSPLQSNAFAGYTNLVNALDTSALGGAGPGVPQAPAIPNVPNVNYLQPTTEQTGAITEAFNALKGATNYQTPQFGPVPTIDPTAAFTQGVVNPLTQNFNQMVLPGIEGQYGGSAGGALSSPAMEARQQAGLNLNQTLAGTGAQYALGAATANQAAQMQAQQAQLNAALTTESLRNQALGLAPTIAGLPTDLTGALTNITQQQGLYPGQLQAQQQGLTTTQLTQQQQEQQAQIQNILAGLQRQQSTAGLLAPALQAGATQYGVAQAPYQQWVQQQTFQNQLLQLLGQLGTTGTTENVVQQTPGTTGILPSLISAAGQVGGAYLGGQALASALPFSQQASVLANSPAFANFLMNQPDTSTGLVSGFTQTPIPS